jgi:hypothetical protein
MRTLLLLLKFVALAVHAQKPDRLAMAPILLGLVGAPEDDFRR